MAGTITDLLSRVTDSSTGRPVVTSLASGKTVAAASITVNDATNWTTESVVHFAIYETNAAGVKDMSTQTDWKGTRAGTTISNLTLTGGTDRAYAAGAVVELTPTARYAKDLYDWGIGHADQDGTLKAGAVDNAAVLAANVVETAKIKDGAVTNSKLSSTAGELGGEWTTWTPTFTNFTLGNGTVTARYQQVGKTVRFYLSVTLGTTSSMGSFDRFTLPVTASSSYFTSAESNPVGLALLKDNSGSTTAGAVRLESETQGRIVVTNVASTYPTLAGLATTIPFTWASSDIFSCQGEYEAA